MLPDCSLFFNFIATIIRIIAIKKSPADDISCVGISGTPPGAKCPSVGNTTPYHASVSRP